MFHPHDSRAGNVKLALLCLAFPQDEFFFSHFGLQYARRAPSYLGISIPRDSPSNREAQASRMFQAAEHVLEPESFFSKMTQSFVIFTVGP